MEAYKLFIKMQKEGELNYLNIQIPYRLNCIIMQFLRQYFDKNWLKFTIIHSWFIQINVFARKHYIQRCKTFVETLSSIKESESGRDEMQHKTMKKNSLFGGKFSFSTERRQRFSLQLH